MDALLGRKPKSELKPANCLGRYVVTKHNQWRGKYRRVLCVTPEDLITLNPEQGMAATNTYSFVGDADIESITVPQQTSGSGVSDEEAEFTISARQDKKARIANACRRMGHVACMRSACTPPPPTSTGCGTVVLCPPYNA